MVVRRVVLVCGPPGSGKTTLAHQLGLPVYDLDDPKWFGSERHLRQALRRLGEMPDAQAVVIRAGATHRARAKAVALVEATEIRVLAVDADTCIDRVVARKRERPSIRIQIAAVKTWWERYQPGPISPVPPDGGAVKAKTAARGYGAPHKVQRVKAKRQVDAGSAVCWRCGQWIDPAGPWDLGHDDHNRRVYRGPEHVACNRGASARRQRRRTAQPRRRRL